jgi:hypothetical protein
LKETNVRPLLFSILVGLLVLGNGFGAWKLFTDKASFFSTIPRLTRNSYILLCILPLLNLLALGGIWYWQKWGVYLAALTSLFVIGLDIYLGIKYHLPVAVISTVLLATAVIYYWKNFNG